MEPDEPSFSTESVDSSLSESQDLDAAGPALATAYREWDTDWSGTIRDPTFVDDSALRRAPYRNRTRYFHNSLKNLYRQLEYRGTRPLDVFLREAIYSLSDQETILRLWLRYAENMNRKRRGTELFDFINEADLGTELYLKFVHFHLRIARKNKMGEMNFREFVHLYQLLAIHYKAKNSLLGFLMKGGHSARNHLSLVSPRPGAETPPSKEWQASRMKLLSKLKFQIYPKGSIVFQQDTPLTHILFIFAGKINSYRVLESGGRQEFSTIGAGFYKGCLEYISRTSLVTSGIAAETTYAVKIPVDGFETLLSFDHRLAWTMATTSLLSVRNIQAMVFSEALSSSPLRKGDHKEETVDDVDETSYSPVLRQAFADAGNEDLSATVEQLISEGKCQLLRKSQRDFICREGDEANAVFILLSGVARRLYSKTRVKTLRSPCFIGDFAMMSGQDHPEDVQLVSPTAVVLKIPRDVLKEMMADNSLVVFDFIRPMVTYVSKHLRALRFPYSYFLLRNGEHLVKPKQSSEDFWFLVNGCLHERTPTSEGKLKFVREYSQPGEVIGVPQMLIEASHTNYVTAVRDTELVRFQKEWITEQMKTNPTGMQQFFKSALRHTELFPDLEMEGIAAKRLIAVMPITDKVNAAGFTSNLCKVFSQNYSPVKVITEESILNRFGKIRSVSLTNERSTIWFYLSEIQKKHDRVVLLLSPRLSPWVRYILQQVDIVLLVTHSSLSLNQLTDWELQLNFYNSEFHLSEKRLVVLHPPETPITNTSRIFGPRSQGSSAVNFLHHVTEGNRLHYESLARCLSGKAVGLVLSGGGRRCFTHLGIVMALRQAGVPIDMIAGTGIGAQIGGLVAAELPLQEVALSLRSAYSFALPFTQYMDFTLPLLSIFSGRSWGSRLRTYLGLNDKRIEDLPIPFFCISANITRLETETHSNGVLWEAMRASSSYPFIFPPFMNEKGESLVHGDFASRIPADILHKRYGANYIIAIDLEGEAGLEGDKLDNARYRDTVSGWKILWDNLWGGKPYESLKSILLKLSRIVPSVVPHDRQHKRVMIDLLMTPPRPPKPPAWTDYEGQDHQIRLGYQHATNILEKLRETNSELFKVLMGKVAYPPPLSTFPLQNPSLVPQTSYVGALLGLVLRPKFLLVAFLTMGITRYFTSLILALIRADRGWTRSQWRRIVNRVATMFGD